MISKFKIFLASSANNFVINSKSEALNLWPQIILNLALFLAKLSKPKERVVRLFREIYSIHLSYSMQLLKHGIKNSVAVEGTNVPKEVVDLSKERTVTAFVDGDRGGQMIIQELLQVAEIDFIARAPENTEVEYLTHKQIMKSLRDKVTAELFMEQNKWARPEAGNSKKPAKKNASKGPSKSSSKPAPKAAAPKAAEPVAEAAVASPVFIQQLDQLQGSKNARLLMGEEMADEVSIGGLQEVLEKHKSNGVNTLVMDGIITQRLIELVSKAGIKTVVAEKKGPLPRDPVGISMFTREDLA